MCSFIDIYNMATRRFKARDIMPLFRRVCLLLEIGWKSLVNDKINVSLFCVSFGIMVLICIIVFDFLPVHVFMRETSATDMSQSMLKSKIQNSQKIPRSYSPDRQNNKDLLSQLFLEMSKTDSIGMIIDLPDSIVLLVCRGVVLRECPVSKYRLSNSWKVLQERGGTAMRSGCLFSKTMEIATIPKIPLTTKIAPRDTFSVEKEWTKVTAGLTKKGDIAAAMWFDGDLVVRMNQRVPFAFHSLFYSASVFAISSAFVEIKHAMVEIIHRKTPCIEFGVSITLSRDDAAILFRATPRHGKMAILI
jgi:hypothetical protein